MSKKPLQKFTKAKFRDALDKVAVAYQRGELQINSDEDCVLDACIQDSRGVCAVGAMLDDEVLQIVTSNLDMNICGIAALNQAGVVEFTQFQMYEDACLLQGVHDNILLHIPYSGLTGKQRERFTTILNKLQVKYGSKEPIEIHAV